jgi:hypothetical protein
MGAPEPVLATPAPEQPREQAGAVETEVPPPRAEDEGLPAPPPPEPRTEESSAGGGEGGMATDATPAEGAGKSLARNHCFRALPSSNAETQCIL